MLIAKPRDLTKYTIFRHAPVSDFTRSDYPFRTNAALHCLQIIPVPLLKETLAATSASVRKILDKQMYCLC